MKRAIILGLLLLVTVISGETPNTEFLEKLVRFHLHYSPFVRAYFGCPKAAVDVAECKPNLGTFDWAEFNHAQRDAGPLFGLERKKD